MSWYHWLMLPGVFLKEYVTPFGWLSLAVIVVLNIFLTTLIAGGTIVSLALGGVGLTWLTGTTIGLGAKILAVILAIIIWLGFWLIVTFVMAMFLFVLTMLFLVTPNIITRGQLNPIKLFIKLDKLMS